MTPAAHASLFRSLFACPVCRGELALTEGGLCASCWQSLAQPCSPPGHIQSPALYPLTALHFSYVLAGPVYSALRRWKNQRGQVFHRILFQSGSRARIPYATRALTPDFVIPVPQSPGRFWQIRGNPQLTVARWLCRELGHPLQAEWLQIAQKPHRQAELRRSERLANSLEFRLHSKARLSISGRRILLVDDFATTGRTLVRAAEILRSNGARDVHAFCVG
ncbi:MAG: ComF family protein, partial [Bacteriovoracia bacterium]